MTLPEVSFVKKPAVEGGKKIYVEYANIPLAFDIEAYSFRDPEGTPHATMWGWGFGIGEDQVTIGRTWPEFIQILDELVTAWDLGELRRCIIWVHNLSYDWQFFRKYLRWSQVFCLEPRHVVYARDVRGIEFRCSFVLSGLSLEKTGENLLRHTVRKLSGTIDYDLPRHSGTVLDDTETEYLKYDVLVLLAYIAECIEAEGGSITKIPLTHTGYVRRAVRDACFRDHTIPSKYDYSKRRYQDLMACLTMDPFIYESLKRAFQGGYTHANPFYARETLEHVTSFDICSDYPSMICSKLYPMSTPQYVRSWGGREDFEKLCHRGCMIFTVRFINLSATFNYDHYISSSKCIITGDRQYSNGRVVRADDLTTTITNVDYIIIAKTYKWDKMFVSGVVRWEWGYLPKPIIDSTITYYEKKTTLKGVQGKEEEYLTSKGLLNAIYGMMVTDPLRPEVIYNLDTNEWGEMDSNGDLIMQRYPDDKTEKITEYNEDPNRFLYYAWGVWITAYARMTLWNAILEFGGDYVYSDTDSIKALNADSHMEYIQGYNQRIEAQIRKCLEYYRMDPDRATPKTIKGTPKPLGVWEVEAIFDRFRTLGAKRYLVETGGALQITVAGLSKQDAVKYLSTQDAFKIFDDGMEIPAEHSGRLIHRYIDDRDVFEVTDHHGVTRICEERSSIHMEGATYTLSMSDAYMEYIYQLMEGLI